MLGGLELSLIFAFFLVKYAIPHAVASVNGKPTARARDKALREEATAKAIHLRKLANLPPPPPSLWEAVSARLAVWIAPTTEPKPPKPPKQKGPWRRAWDALVTDAGAQAERYVTDVRFERKNKKRRRNGQKPIVIDVYPCLGCSGSNVVDHPTRLCPSCTRAKAEQAAAQPSAQPEGAQPAEDRAAPRFPCARGCGGGTVWLPGMVCGACSHIDEPPDRDAGSARQQPARPQPARPQHRRDTAAEAAATQRAAGRPADGNAPASSATEPSSYRCHTCERNPDGPCPTCRTDHALADDPTAAEEPADVAFDADTGPIPVVSPADGPPPAREPRWYDPETPAPTDAGDTTTRRNNMSQPVHIDPNARDATGAPLVLARPWAPDRRGRTSWSDHHPGW